MEDKLKMLKLYGYSDEFISAIKVYIESVDFDLLEPLKDTEEKEDSIESNDIIIDSIEPQNQIFFLTD